MWEQTNARAGRFCLHYQSRHISDYIGRIGQPSHHAVYSVSTDVTRLTNSEYSVKTMKPNQQQQHLRFICMTIKHYSIVKG